MLHAGLGNVGQTDGFGVGQRQRFVAQNLHYVLRFDRNVFGNCVAVSVNFAGGIVEMRFQILQRFQDRVAAFVNGAFVQANRAAGVFDLTFGKVCQALLFVGKLFFQEIAGWRVGVRRGVIRGAFLAFAFNGSQVGSVIGTQHAVQRLGAGILLVQGQTTFGIFDFGERRFGCCWLGCSKWRRCWRCWWLLRFSGLHGINCGLRR